MFTADEREVYRVTRAMVEAHGRWVFDTPKHLILNLALGGNYPAKERRARAIPRTVRRGRASHQERRREGPRRLGANTSH